MQAVFAVHVQLQGVQEGDEVFGGGRDEGTVGGGGGVRHVRRGCGGGEGDGGREAGMKAGGGPGAVDLGGSY